MSSSARGLLVVHSKCVRAVEQPERDAWEDDVHFPALCGSGGAWAATRFELTVRPEPGMPGIGFTHVTILELDDLEVAAQAPRVLAVDELGDAGRMHPAHTTIAADVFAAGRKHECHTGALTLTLRPTGRHGGDGIRRIG